MPFQALDSHNQILYDARMPVKLTLKNLTKHPIFIRVMSFVASLILRAIYLTCRKRNYMHPNAQAFFKGNEQGILCFWHGRLIAIPIHKPKCRKIHVLISHHGDGEWIAQIIRWFGIDTIRGSSSNGAVSAMKGLMKVAKAGDNLCFTPDGPRGPRHEAANGAIWAAKATGLPLYPISFSSSRAKSLRSWDQFMIPKPFSTLHYCMGEPIAVPRDADDVTLEALRKRLQKALNSATDECDVMAGQSSESFASHASDN